MKVLGKVLAVKVQMLSDCTTSMRWVDPVGWHPTTVIDGYSYDNGAWWDDNDDEAFGIAWIGDVNAYGVRDCAVVDFADLRVVSRSDCSVVCELDSIRLTGKT